MPRLMNDLARLGLSRRIFFQRLRGGQVVEHTLGDPRILPKTLHGSDDSVTSKHCAEPGNTGVGIVRLGVPHDHHVDIRE